MLYVVLYQGDAVLYTGRFRKVFQNERTPKDLREILPKRKIGSYGNRGRSEGEN